MTRDYDPYNPLINSKLIKKINEAKKNKGNEAFIDFLNELYDAEFLIPVKNSSILDENTMGIDVIILKNDDEIYLPIFTNILELKKLEGIKKDQHSLITDFYDCSDLAFMLSESGMCGITIDPFGVNLKLSLEFIENAEEIIKQQKQNKMIKEMHEYIMNNDN